MIIFYIFKAKIGKKEAHLWLADVKTWVHVTLYIDRWHCMTFNKWSYNLDLYSLTFP